MTSFEAGFFKQAQESGLSSEEAFDIFKKSSTHPELTKLCSAFLKYSGDDCEELEKLSCMLELDEVDREMQAIAQFL